MSSQNEETQTPIKQTPEIQTPVTQTQRHKPRGVTAMKSVVRARSNNNKLAVEWNAKGQPLNKKGGNKLVSYIGVLATFDVDEQHKDYIMKSVGKALREFRTNCGKCLRDAEVNVNLKPPAR
ncbi:hypothetical protein Lal_00033225 [Lupinus albus]|nr:hypothetical protein Lal_00033225 [Lupinus albus]